MYPHKLRLRLRLRLGLASLVSVQTCSTPEPVPLLVWPHHEYALPGEEMTHADSPCEPGRAREEHEERRPGFFSSAGPDERPAVVHTLQERLLWSTSNACFRPRTIADAEKPVYPMQPQKCSPYEHPEVVAVVGVSSRSLVFVDVNFCNSSSSDDNSNSCGSETRIGEVFLI